MTYNVLSGTLSLYTTTTCYWSICVNDQIKTSFGSFGKWWNSVTQACW